MSARSGGRMAVALLVGLWSGAGFGQSAGLLYSTQRPASAASGAATTATVGMPAASIAAVAPPNPAASAVRAAESTVKAIGSAAQTDTRTLLNQSEHRSSLAQAPSSSAGVVGGGVQAGPGDAARAATVAVPPQTPATTNKVTVHKRSDGSRVIRAEVPPALAEAEAAVAQQLVVPTIGPASPTMVPLSGAGAQQGLGAEIKPLPKWVTSSLDRTSGKNQIVVMPGVTEIVRIARGFPNRFRTPFDNAEVVTTDENLTHDGVAGAVIVATAADRPIGIFVQDRNSDRAIPLVLIPEDIPQRDIGLVLDDSWGPPQLRNMPDASANTTPPGGQSEYVEFVKSIMRSLALGDIPDGHAMSPLQPEAAPVCQIPGLTVRLGQMLEGSRSRVAVYKATNQTQVTIPVQEAGCYRAGVLAVSAYPRPVLEPGQDTEVYVVLRKDAALVNRGTGKRRPVLVSQ